MKALHLFTGLWKAAHRRIARRYLAFRIKEAERDTAFDEADLLTLPKRIKEHKASVATWRDQLAALQPARPQTMRKAVNAFCATPPQP